MNKETFINLINITRENNKNINGRIKKKYKKIDDEMMWRLFQIFPSHWSDEDRFRGIKLLTVHLTVLVTSLINDGVSTENIVDAVYFDLKDRLDYRLSKKYIREFVSQVSRVKSLNNL